MHNSGVYDFNINAIPKNKWLMFRYNDGFTPFWCQGMLNGGTEFILLEAKGVTNNDVNMDNITHWMFVPEIPIHKRVNKQERY